MSYMKRMLLPLNLQMFAEDGGGDGGSGDNWIDDYYSGKNGDDNKGDNKKDENFIPKSRFDSVNTKYKELLESAKTRDTEYEELSKQLEASGTTKAELEQTIDAGNLRIGTLEKVIQGILDSELEAIDEEYHELVPKDKPIEEQLDWLRKAKNKGLFGSKGYDFEIGQPSNPRNQKGGTKTEGMNPIQMLTMGYGSR